MLELTPRQIVEELDKYIVGQKDAKRAIAVAIRNRWRRQRVEGDMRDEIGPKNMMMIGPTGVGKTEIARRLAALTGAPFVKVDATKYTEVGYYGRDVESMARDLVENAIGIVRSEEREKNEGKAREAADERLISALSEKFTRSKRDLSEFEELLTESQKERFGLLNKQEETSSDGVIEPEVVGLEEKPATETNVDDSNDKSDDDTSFEAMTKRLFGDSNEGVIKGIKVDPSDPASIANMFSTIGSMIFSGGSSKDSDSSSKEKDSPSDSSESKEKKSTDDKVSTDLRQTLIETAYKAGKFEEETVPVVEERRMSPVVMGGVGFGSMADDFQSMLENIAPKRNSRRELTVREARDIFIEQESERLLDKDKINERAIDLAENLGIIFIDEIDKIVGSEGGHGADVSRQGVQRDLLPIVEGTTIQTKYGLFSTEHVLFIAAGAFHRVKPSDLTPELQGRFPIRVELSELKKEDFVRILTEPKSALTKQYAALMETENVELIFKDDAIDALAEYATQTNLTTQNIGARRLCTIMELLLEDLNFEAAEMESGRVEIDAEYVRSKIEKVVQDEDLSKFVL